MSFDYKNSSIMNSAQFVSHYTVCILCNFCFTPATVLVSVSIHYSILHRVSISFSKLWYNNLTNVVFERSRNLLSITFHFLDNLASCKSCLFLCNSLYKLYKFKFVKVWNIFVTYCTRLLIMIGILFKFRYNAIAIVFWMIML